MKPWRMMYVVLLLLCAGGAQVRAAAPPPVAGASAVAADCVAATGDQAARCEVVACPAPYGDFAGRWAGDFVAYVRKLSTPGKPVYRPYHDSVVYPAGECLKDAVGGDVFVVGHRTDRYPAFGALPPMTDRGLLILGRKADGTPFMRTVDGGRRYDYTLAYRDAAASLSVWTLHLPAADGQPAMRFTTIDARDLAALPAQRRDVTVTMSVGPAQAPYWRGVLAYGSHTRQ